MQQKDNSFKKTRGMSMLMLFAEHGIHVMC